MAWSVSGFSSHVNGFGDGCHFPIQPHRVRNEVPQGRQGVWDPVGSAGNQQLPAPGCFPGRAQLQECQLLNESPALSPAWGVNPPGTGCVWPKGRVRKVN